MPTTYAHDLFGKRVYKKLDEDIRIKIRENQELFRIGVHGPDILFYYKPFGKNKVNKLGSRIHWEIARDFFLKGKKIYDQDKDDAFLVYLLGFICHYMLDSNCHPYIGEYVNAGKATHTQIEAEFDRYLMEKTAQDPFSFKPAKAIMPSAESAKVIHRIIDEVSEKEILDSLRGIRLYNNITVGNAVYRGLLLKGAKLLGCYDYADGRVLPDEPLASCMESTEFLAKQFEIAVNEAAEVIKEFLLNLSDTDNISARFNRNFE